MSKLQAHYDQYYRNSICQNHEQNEAANSTEKTQGQIWFSIRLIFWRSSVSYVLNL